MGKGFQEVCIGMMLVKNSKRNIYKVLGTTSLFGVAGGPVVTRRDEKKLVKPENNAEGTRFGARPRDAGEVFQGPGSSPERTGSVPTKIPNPKRFNAL
jgi:hypothetical protein